MNFNASAVSRMVGEKPLHLGGVGLAGARVQFGREELLVKSFGRAEREDRQADHRSSPKLTVRQGELEPQAAHGVRRVGRVGLADPQREAAKHRRRGPVWEQPLSRAELHSHCSQRDRKHQRPWRDCDPETGVDAADFLKASVNRRGVNAIPE